MTPSQKLIAAAVLAAASIGLATAPSCDLPIPLPDIPIIDGRTQEYPGSTVFVVYERSQGAPDTDTGMILGSNKYWLSLADRSLKYALLPDTLAEGDLLNTAKATGLPALVIVSTDGTVLSKTKLPPTIEELDAKVKKATGL